MNEVLTRTGMLYGGDIKMDQTLSEALSEEGVQKIFGQRLSMGTDTGKAAWWLKSTNLDYIKQQATDPEPGVKVDLTFGIRPDSAKYRPLAREVASTFDGMKGEQTVWNTWVRGAEASAVAAVRSAEQLADSQREEISEQTSTTKEKLVKARQSLKRAQDKVDELEKDLVELKRRPEKIDTDLASARLKACAKLHGRITVADRVFQRTAFRFFFGHAMKANGDQEGLVHRLMEGENPVLDAADGQAALAKLPAGVEIGEVEEARDQQRP